MSVSAVAPTPFYQDPDRLQIGLPQPRAEAAKTAGADDSKHLAMFAEGDDSPSFWDVLDIVNPLQHIPIVNDLYREATGDKIGVGARLVGGALFGGVIGLAASAVNCMVEESTGSDVGTHVLALFRDDAAPTAPDATQFAAAPSPDQPAALAQAVTPAPVQLASAAPATTAAPTNAAPIIALPNSAPAATGQPMMFSFDGAQPITAAAAPPAPMAAPVAQVTSKPLGGPAHFLPTPSRNSNVNPMPLPQVTVPVANGSSRSNVPITGRAPNAAAPNTNAAMQRALAGQDAGHPMLPPVDANGQTAANPDWFSAAWGQALDKYQRAGQVNGKPTTSITVE